MDNVRQGKQGQFTRKILQIDFVAHTFSHLTGSASRMALL